jgi:hypothetical protein
MTCIQLDYPYTGVTDGTGMFVVPKNCHIKETKKWLKVRDDMDFVVAQFSWKFVVGIFDKPESVSTP